MRGKIEVYTDFNGPEESLVYEGANTIVDGAGETIADIMMAPTSLSGIPDLSSILDTSNYTIQSMSFAKDPSGYYRNAHSCEAGTNKAQRVLKKAQIFLVSPQTDLTLSSYDPSFAGKILPSFVHPRQRILEYPTLPSGTFESGAVDYDINAASPAIVEKGQNLNVLGLAAQLEDTMSNLSGIGGVYGCYPDSSAYGGTEFFVVSSDSAIHPTTSNDAVHEVIYSGVYNSLFNSVSSMDAAGFLNFVGSSTTDDYIASGWSGVTVSACTESDPTKSEWSFSSTGEIVYKAVIGSGDLGSANLYGGIYDIGLWALDLCSSLKQSSPPFAFGLGDNPRKYKLFSKKSLLDNLCRISDNASNPDPPGSAGSLYGYRDLTLIWRLYFI